MTALKPSRPQVRDVKPEPTCRDCRYWVPGRPLGSCYSPKLALIGVTERRTRADFHPCDLYEARRDPYLSYPT